MRSRQTWLPALIGGLAALTSAGITAISQHRQNKQNATLAKEQMDYQWQHYQSPQAQKSAYNAAGINPFVQGSIQSISPQSQIPDQLAPGVIFGQQLSSFISPLVQLLMVNSQLKNIGAQTEKTQSEIAGQNTLNQGYELDNRLKEFDLGHIKPETLKEIKSRIESTQAGTGLTRKQIKLAAENILKTQYEAQGVDLKNRYQQMENEWKRIQGEKGMPSNLADWQELQNRRLQQQINIDLPEEDLRKVKEAMFKNFHKLFDYLNDDKTLGQSFAGIPLVEPGQKAIFRGILSLLLYKLMVGF